MMVKKLFLVGIMLLSLTGCVKGNVDIEFIDESNASLTIEVLIQEDLLDSYGTSLTDLKHKLTNSELSTWENKELKKDINGTQYIGFQLIAPKDINKSLLSFFTTNKKKELIKLRSITVLLTIFLIQVKLKILIIIL